LISKIHKREIEEVKQTPSVLGSMTFYRLWSNPTDSNDEAPGSR